MDGKNNGMQAYGMAASAVTSAGLAVGGLTLGAVFAKNALIGGDAKAGGYAAASVAFATAAAFSTYRQIKALYRLSLHGHGTNANTGETRDITETPQHTPKDP